MAHSQYCLAPELPLPKVPELKFDLEQGYPIMLASRLAALACSISVPILRHKTQHRDWCTGTPKHTQNGHHHPPDSPKGIGSGKAGSLKPNLTVDVSAPPRKDPLPSPFQDKVSAGCLRSVLWLLCVCGTGSGPLMKAHLLSCANRQLSQAQLAEQTVVVPHSSCTFNQVHECMCPARCTDSPVNNGLLDLEVHAQDQEKALVPERDSDDDSDTDFLTTDKLVAETFYNLFPDAFSEIMPVRNHRVGCCIG